MGGAGRGMGALGPCARRGLLSAEDPCESLIVTCPSRVLPALGLAVGGIAREDSALAMVQEFFLFSRIVREDSACVMQEGVFQACPRRERWCRALKELSGVSSPQRTDHVSVSSVSPACEAAYDGCQRIFEAKHWDRVRGAAVLHK